MNDAPHDSTDQLFFRGFDNEDFDLVYEEAPLASFRVPAPIGSQVFSPVVATTTPPVDVFTSSTIPIANTSRVEIGSSSSNRMMKIVTIEVPEDGNLLKTSGQADIWLNPLIGLVQKSKLESHSSLRWMNDVVHSSLKINLTGTELMKRIVNTEQLVNDYRKEADNWREQ
ncbi:uncharacterized protein LOC107767575 isoform X1 [Nicotiana tabacum]|uniref:Uncharacterized protein isoform X1 n=3 Tax=Nicotiana tabacum TaxID=4097 RepID=A0A1S3XQG3_TOBAC|nr:PREDICTED: uncharacterized protein LOC107767575 isoform X1 [Nicotiana tabacum]